MSHMDPISGVSLEKYAQLCAAMAKTGEDTAAQVAIAAEMGVDEGSWQAAKDGWTARMSDASNQGKVAHAFYPLYSAAQAAMRGGAEPMPLEKYARIVAEYSFEKDASGAQVNVNVVLARYGLDTTSWAEVTGYWTPKVNDPNDPSAGPFRVLVQAESDRIFGIDRSGGGQASPPEPAPAAPAAPAPTTPKPPPQADAPEPEAGGVMGMVMGWIKSLMG